MIEIRSLRDVFRLFFIFQQEFRIAVLVSVAVAVLGAFLLPSSYQSEARLLVKPGRETATVPIEYGDRQTLVAPSTQRDPIVDEEKMLTGRPIIRQVAEYTLQALQGGPPQGWWKRVKFHLKKFVAEIIEAVRGGLIAVGLIEYQTPAERLATRLEKKFEVEHTTGSSVIEISFTWDDPLIAQRIVDKWISLYQDERTQALGRKSLYGFYEAESGRIAKQVARIKDEISQHLRAIDGISAQERLESLTDRLNKLVAERAEAKAEKHALEKGIARSGNRIHSLPAEIVSEREISLNPAQQDLEIKLNALQLERLDKLRDFQPEAPVIRELDAAIAALRLQVEAEPMTVQRSENRTPNELVTALRRGALERDTRVSELQARLTVYDQDIAAIKNERQRILRAEPRLSRLERDLAVAEKSYALYLDSLEKARIDRELDNSRISNIAVIEQATFSPARVFPKSLLILLLALPAAIAVGLFVLYLCYLLDQRIHDGGKMEKRLGVPLWATIMDVGAEPGGELTPAFQASLYRLYSLLPLAQVQERGLTVGLTSGGKDAGVSFVTQHFLKVLQDRQISARLSHDLDDKAAPGEVLLLDAPMLISNHKAFVQLKQADLVLLVVAAARDTVPMVENALSILTTAFGKVDGIVLNRRRFEIPARWLRRMDRLKVGS
jgi:uncharacterized protein involved in exopolysaccharide biosynthesis